MDLFRAAGVELSDGGHGGGRRRRSAPRTLRVPLFNHRVVEEARRRVVFAPTPEQSAIAAEYARTVRDPKFARARETAVRNLFFTRVLESLLGYTPYSEARPYTMAFEHAIRRGAVDVALGHFAAPDVADIVAPFEMKGPDTADLDAILPGRGRSPVQQAWDYAIDTPGARWVLVSNCVEIRLYGFGRGRDAYELFDLRHIDEPEEHARLWLILSADRLLGGETDILLRETDSAYRTITTDLYADYSDLRRRLIQYLVDRPDGPKLAPLAAIEVAQKLLDRVLFVAFAERTDLLPDRLLERSANAVNEFDPKPKWFNFQKLFRFIDQGNQRLGIWAYNGGLFAADPVADDPVLPDELATEIARLGQWDYRRDVPVTVLGHIFEQSITDIERMRAESLGLATPKISKRKREGVVYTPDTVTRFLVERTVGLTLGERFEALWAEHGFGEAERSGKTVPDPDREMAFWRDYLTALRDLTVVDPACGSGAFLVAAFDALAREYRQVTDRLETLGADIDFDPYDEIVTRNLYGVDLNAESVEITRLSLWLKTARRDHRLQNLEATIRVGDSLVGDPAYTPRPFDWRAAFPEVFARGGFDIVIGNPPYVRMELIKAVKPYLAEHYTVAADRTDLYAYFFERGVCLLKEGGRLGYISSSTFFRTGSGERLRLLLAEVAAIETVIDFGDLQLFEGVTTYPAIVTLRRAPGGEGDLRFLNVTDSLPKDLGARFEAKARPMPRARLGAGSWRFEGDALAALRDKIAAGRPTLGEVYGPPLYGIKTGLNKAFVIDRDTRDRLVAADPKSADLLKPFLRGENVKRWRVESEDLYLINTPKGVVDIEDYPAIRDWLLPFRPELEKRATKQEWWELQQAQLAYQPRFADAKIIYLDIANVSPFALDETGSFIDCTVFMVSFADRWLLPLLNAKISWFQWVGQTPVASGGYIRLKSQYIGPTALPDPDETETGRLTDLGECCTAAATRRFGIQTAVRRRILDLAPPERRTLGGRLSNWWELDFPAFLAEVRKAFRRDIPLKERGEWEDFLAGNAAEVRRLGDEIAAAEREIDAIVYRLFDLTDEEIALLEASLEGQY